MLASAAFKEPGGRVGRGGGKVTVMWLQVVRGAVLAAACAAGAGLASASAAMDDAVLENSAPPAALVRIAAYDQASALLASGDVEKAGAVLEALAAAYGDALDHAMAAAAAAVRGRADGEVMLRGVAKSLATASRRFSENEAAFARDYQRDAAAALYLQRSLLLLQIERGQDPPVSPLPEGDSGDPLGDPQEILAARAPAALAAFARAARGDAPDLEAYAAMLTYDNGLDAEGLLWLAGPLEADGGAAGREAWRALAGSPCLAGVVSGRRGPSLRPSFRALWAREAAALAAGFAAGKGQQADDAEAMAGWELTARIALAMAPGDTGMAHGLADALQARDKAAQADALLAQTPTRDHNYVCALFHRALLAAGQDNGPLAAAAQQRRRDLARAAPGLELLLPVALAQDGDARLTAIAQSLAAGPPSAVEAALRAARIAELEQQGRSEETIADLEALTVLQPDNWSWFNSLGYTLVQRDGPTAEAITALRRSIDLHRNAFNLDSLGWALFRSGRIAEGARLLAEALALDAGQGEIRANLGDIRAAQGRLGEATRLWETALALGLPDHVLERVRRNLATAQGAI